MVSWLAQVWKVFEYTGLSSKVLENKIFLEKYLKTLKGLEKSLNFTIYRRIQECFWDLNQFKIVLLLFGAAYAAPNKGTTILY